MNTSFPRFLAGFLVVQAALVAASFEGKVNFNMTSGGEKPMAVNYSIKGNRMRVDMPGMKGMGGMIMDLGRREMCMIMDSERMYMTMSLDGQQMQAAQAKAGEMKFEKTGETLKILGLLATKYIASDRSTTTELWLAEGLGTFMGFSGNPMGGGGRGGPAPQAWEKALAGKDLFPLRVVGKDKGGKETFRMEATAVERQSLPDSLFSPPEGYQKFDMGAMGGMMQGLMQGIGR